MRLLLLFASLTMLAACASKGAAPSASSAPETKLVKSIDGSYTGEVVGTIVPGSRFSKVRIGMELTEVTRLIDPPDDAARRPTGKAWIPFYFGNEALLLVTYYAGEGCLTFTGGNVFGGGGTELVRIEVDKTKACFE